MNDPGFTWMPFQNQPLELLIRRREEQLSIKRQSVRAGLCVIALLVLQYVVVFILYLTPLHTMYEQSEEIQALIDLFLYLLCMLLPFTVAYLKMPQNDRQTTRSSFGKPISMAAALMAVLAGFLACNAANYVTNILISLVENAGFTVEGGTYETPETGESLIYSLVTIGILTAFVEEFALRGVVMQPLRRHGDRFAILMSAFIFALMHGNLTQFIFAFPVGLVLGYFVVETNSVWVGIVIHLLNNTDSVILNYLLAVRPTAADRFFNLETAIALVFGILGLVLFLTIGRRNRLQKGTSVLTSGEKAKAFLVTAPMVISIVLLAVQTIRLISFEGT